jgi:hypothetical protein
MPCWRSAVLIKYGENFTFYLSCCSQGVVKALKFGERFDVFNNM